MRRAAYIYSAVRSSQIWCSSGSKNRHPPNYQHAGRSFDLAAIPSRTQAVFHRTQCYERYSFFGKILQLSKIQKVISNPRTRNHPAFLGSYLLTFDVHFSFLCFLSIVFCAFLFLFIFLGPCAFVSTFCYSCLGLMSDGQTSFRRIGKDRHRRCFIFVVSDRKPQGGILH